MRGEYAKEALGNIGQWELPPRARRILIMNHTLVSPIGTTSACAENTQAKIVFIENTGNYLRVRGEYRWVAGRV